MRKKHSNPSRIESRTDSEQSPAALLSDQEVDRLRIAFEMHADKEEAAVRVKHWQDLLNALFISPAALLSDQEVDRLRIAFEMHADKEEAVVPTQHLQDLLKTLFIVPTKPEMSSLTSTMDPDETGKIDFDSFFFAITAFIKPQYGRDMLDRAFAEISGGRNMIDRSSLQRTMKHLGQSTIRVQDCQAMISEVDREGKGRISKEDFQHLQTYTLDNL